MTTDGGGPAHEARFSVSCEDPDRADRVRAAVAREIGEIDDGRSRARVHDGHADDATVTVAVDARDVSALRAATGSWLGLLEAAGRTAAVAERTQEDDG